MSWLLKGKSIDLAAEAYLDAVEAADAAELESEIRAAVNSFVIGCKLDGTWNAIKASCILAGARTLNGALVPLAGTAPTNSGFVSGDYSRKSGLLGDAVAKYLDTNRNNNADPQNNNHNAVFASTIGINTLLQLAAAPITGANSISVSIVRNRNTTAAAITAAPGLIGHARQVSTSYVYRNGGSTVSVATASQAPQNANLTLLRADTVYGNSRVAYYSIGEYLDLALLDTRITRLVNEIAFFINTGLDGSIYNIDTLRYVNAGYDAGGTLS